MARLNNNSRIYIPKKEDQDKVAVNWAITSERDIADYAYKFTVVCPRCGQLVLKYKDAVRLVPKEVEHCGVRDTFYIGEEIT